MVHLQTLPGVDRGAPGALIMGLIIMKIGKKYVAWSTEWDRPMRTATGAIAAFNTPRQLERFVITDAVRREREEFKRRMERVEAKGTSHVISSFEGLVECNRAGPGEKRLTLEQLVELVGG